MNDSISQSPSPKPFSPHFYLHSQLREPLHSLEACPPSAGDPQPLMYYHFHPTLTNFWGFFILTCLKINQIKYQ
jgi:hypothetical protein